MRRWAGRFGTAAGLLLVAAMPLSFAVGKQLRARVTRVIERRTRLAAQGGQGTSTPAPFRPPEIAAGVYRLTVYGTNVYFVRSGSSWVLIDAAWPFGKCGRKIREAAEGLFGPNARPEAILLTHVHPDHDGAALELARTWGCPVYVPPEELPLAVAADLATVERFAIPLDRRILPVLRALPRRRVETMLARGSLKEVARAFDPKTPVPGLPDWTGVPTPGHSPGHVTFFRERDRVLITGDAVLTVDVNSLRGWLAWWLRLNPPRVFGPPWYSNWDQRATDASVSTLAALEPKVLATGHGAPMAGDAVARELRMFAGRLVGAGAGQHVGATDEFPAGRRR